MIKFSFDPHCQIIHIGSTFSSIGYPGYVSYCASKFALPGATEALAREYGNSPVKFRYFLPRATEMKINHSYVIEMNVRIGTTIDSPEFVAQEFHSFLQKDGQSYEVGYPEKFFIKVNQVLPSIVTNFIQKDLNIIYKYFEKITHDL